MTATTLDTEAAPVDQAIADAKSAADFVSRYAPDLSRTSLRSWLIRRQGGRRGIPVNRADALTLVVKWAFGD